MTANPLERAFEWSPDKVRWYRDACEYSENDRNARIADAVMGQLPTFPSVCDIGCGIGCLSLELAKQASRMLALELNTYALSVLISQVNDDQITNIETMQGDFATLPPPEHKFDGAVLCMFGGIEEYVKTALSWTKPDGRVFYITGTGKWRNFSASKAISSHYSLDDIRAYLDGERFSYNETIIPTKFGQPLSSFEEALHFMRSYDRESTDNEIERVIRERLQETGDRAFPFYLPSDKEYVMFSIEN